MKCQQLLLSSFLVVLSMVGCGKKEDSSPAASKPSTTNQNQVNNARVIELSKIEILSAETRELAKGLSEVTGIYKGELNSVIPCSLTKPIELRDSLSGSTPIVNLIEVFTANSGIRNGKISTFEIKRNEKNQSIIGLNLSDSSGKVIAAHSNNYNDVSADPVKCTQMLTEKYKMHNPDGTSTRRMLNIVSVLEGDVITKTTTIVDDTRILAIQIETVNGDVIDQHCVRDAKLVQNADNKVAHRAHRKNKRR